ncbi:MAG TPA: carboxypeptidase regulatory-like domain-containing protein [Candidatus Eisenbacteria bacterium]|nr:carboxypeptidase regulatory-like domain-containing protein [Candidatus Eisenbacteria bacterium]
MRFSSPLKRIALLAAAALCLSTVVMFAQETTGGLQGTVKDASGAVIGGAHVVVRGTTMAGEKALDSESTGYYRFANLPPGTYSIEVSAKGFKTVKREGIGIETGHLPSVDITMEIGAASEVVEVSGQAPVIDVTTNTNQTNVTQEVLDNTPHGYSFQSVIQFAPMARNEPLGGSMTGMGGNGGAAPGSTSSGANNGYMIGGAADSESTYLVEGQDTENISMGFSNANVPFQFIQEVQVKTSGIEAEHGGALGGVVNVIMKKGSNAYHGSAFATYESNSMDGSPIASLRYDPFGAPSATQYLDTGSQIYQPKTDHFRYVQPGFNIGGPIVKDRLWFFFGLAPLYRSTGRTVNFGPNICNSLSPGDPAAVCPNYSLGNQYFTQDSQQYYGTLRLDATLTSKIRVFGSWLYQYGRETGANLPNADPVSSQSAYLINTSILGTTLQGYSHGLGFSSPNSSYSTGADITLTPKIVSTTRFGYYFNNYHDFGWPTSGSDINWNTTGLGVGDNAGNASLPPALQQGAGAFTTPYTGTFTQFNASKHYQLDEDVAFFKSGWAGTHNIKVGYQYNRMSNVINQNGNVPFVSLTLGTGIGDNASTTTGGTNCALLTAQWGTCAGQYGFAQITDFATILKQPAIDNNHAFFAQDAWTVGHGLTLNLGIRIEKEDLPVPAGVVPTGYQSPSAIHFSWGDKIEPRLGAAWGSANGKLKIFGSYGVVNDVMKLLVAQTSWGAQGYNTCTYPVGPNASGGFSLSDITATFVDGRACPNGPSTTGANFTGGAVPTVFTDAPTGVQLIENVDYRPWEPIAPGVKPYRQHEYVAGVDYQLSRNWALEGRYDRRRLDHAIEDASLADPENFEMYTIVNPGQGVNKTIDGYANYLQSIGQAYGVPGVSFNSSGLFGTCPSCPNNPEAIRNYDGFEVRLTKSASKGWAGMFSYTWSSLWGNYTGLTTTDQIDGGTTGRASPDTTRSFDEPYYYFTYQGKSNAGPLPTDRPNALKGNVYYTLPWKGMASTFGLFQVAYQGSPVTTSSEVGIGYTSPIEDTYIFGRGKWANITQDPNTGALSFGNPYDRRTPWYTQTDANFAHMFKVNKNNEHQTLQFTATIQNLFNQRSVVSYWQTMSSYQSPSGLYPVNSAVQGGAPQNIFGGAAFYQAAETGYNLQASATAAPYVLHSGYGQPNLWQRPRAIRLGVQFNF